MALAQRQIPGGAYINEVDTKQRQIPANGSFGGFVGIYVNETSSAGGGGTLYTQSIAGTVTPAGAYTSNYIAARSVLGTITGVGVVVKSTNKFFAGNTTASGVIVKQTARNVTGSVTPSGGVLKNTARKLTATITASGALATLFATSRSVAGAFTMAATLATQLYNAVVGGLASRFYTLRRFLGRR